GTTIGSAASPYDLSAFAGISYTYQGGGHTVRVETTEVTDYDVFGVSVAASKEWKTVTLPFKSFAQEGWGTKVTFEPSHATAISFGLRGATGDSASLRIDNLKVIKTLGELPPDMQVKPASPPADAQLETIEISSPLQAKAMQYLTKGYNITNWLEEKQFSGFDYDESYIEKLAQAGYKSLRLPVDLDRYVEERTGTGDALDITVSSDLFTILDAFDTWTKKHGLSLTIDYHHYSTLLDKTDVDSIGTAVKLWGKVAEHFASSPREDLFFELLNEPELSFDADPTQAEWTSIAERMIAAIRAKDTTHTLIFGDTSWYGIDALITREPLSDSNVIYAFHNYDPFIFTHQGASWASMASTRDLPYPYDETRWSPYFLELGFNSSMETWVLNAVRNYYREGNKATLRNKILSAKRWAVENNVPIICNEFGAYDLTSQLADRARYYTDVIEIFDELAIPWQHWFMLMNQETGNVIPEYRTALGLVVP
ncbi:MAG TPA: cellulase family glycosylhydrolase, partial [Polyangiaceae bacterium]|nr:cellulase family glycosylhydrolase [Polyangiaceae bacterium]